MDYNSSKNQEIKGQLVQREIVWCVSALMTHLFEQHNHGDWEDEIMNLSGQREDWEGAAEDIGWSYDDDKDVWYKDEWNYDADNEIWTDDDGDEMTPFDTAEEVCEDEGIDPNYSEIYEYWIVNDWFGEKLKQEGEIVEELLGMTVWGRCTTGQAILLDHVISKIAEGMEILEGQKNEW